MLPCSATDSFAATSRWSWHGRSAINPGPHSSRRRSSCRRRLPRPFGRLLCPVPRCSPATIRQRSASSRRPRRSRKGPCSSTPNSPPRSGWPRPTRSCCGCHGDPGCPPTVRWAGEPATRSAAGCGCWPCSPMPASADLRCGRRRPHSHWWCCRWRTRRRFSAKETWPMRFSWWLRRSRPTATPATTRRALRH